MAGIDTPRALTARQARFVAALLTCGSVDAAAEVAGIARRTAQRYKADPLVRRALSQALDDAMSGATRQVVAAMGAALATLEDIHKDKGAPAGARVSAARAILEAGPRLREIVDLAQRVAALEERVGGGGR